jgi:hypothetical protein
VGTRSGWARSTASGTHGRSTKHRTLRAAVATAALSPARLTETRSRLHEPLAHTPFGRADAADQPERQEDALPEAKNWRSPLCERPGCDLSYFAPTPPTPVNRRGFHSKSPPWSLRSCARSRRTP